VDVVAHACAVRRRIITAENAEPLPAAHGHLADVGHQVVGIPAGILADEPAGMGADGIEVAQQGDLPSGVGGVEILEDLLDHEFGSAVGIGRR